MAGIPVAIWVQDLWPESITAAGMMRSPWLASLVERLSRTIYGSCDLVLGQSRAIAARLVESGVARERIGYLPNWAEDLYRPTSRSIQVPEAWEQGFCLMFAGNLGRVQALDTLLDAVKLTQDDSAIHWVFLGDGPLRAWLGEEARRRGLSRVHLLGRRPVTEMPAFFSRAHAMLVSLKPDQTMALTVPTKLQSYLACGRPVVASLDGEGARVVVESGAGFAAPAGDADALARAVRKMKGLTSLEREERGRAGRDYYLREFDRPRCLDSAEAFLGKLTSERKAQASSARP
jgi:glycosyltransferase involved in cell wall biosynthesis